MPTDISNALGTARQFTPQPDAMYQERLNGVSAFQHQAAQGISNADLIAANMQKLTTAMRSYEMAEEKRRDEWGLESATRMLNGMTADDIMKLDVIDAAQTAGYVNETDNPYFLAYSDKIRGEFLSTKARQEYDAKYAEAPAASTDEEVARYKEFSAQWLKDNVKAKNWNQTAFDKGFNENSLVNQTSIASEYTKKKLDESMKTLYANTRAQLSHLAEAFPSMKKDELTAKVQEVLNEPRLMGLDVNLRFRLLDEFTQNMVKSGYIDAERLEQMAKNITIQTNMDGTKRTMYDFLDTHSLAVQANNYQAQFYTREQHGFIEEHKNDPNMDKTFQYLESIKNTDPPTYRRLAPYANTIKNMQIENTRRREAERQKASLKAFSVEAANATIKANLTAYLNGDPRDAYRNYIGKIRVPKGDKTYRAPTEDELMDVFESELQKTVNNQDGMSETTQSSTLMKLFSYPPFKNVKKAYITQYGAALRDIRPETITGSDGNIYLPQIVGMLVASRNADSSKFAGAFGSDIDKTIARIQKYTDIKGSIEEGTLMYAHEAATPDEIRSNHLHTARSLLAGSTIEKMSELGGVETTDILLAGEAIDYVEAQATAYMCAGMSAKDATGQALNDVRDGFNHYHGALIPKNVFTNMGTSNNDEFGRQALYYAMYDFASKAYANTDNVTMKYDTTNQTFTFAVNGDIRTVTLADIRNEGKYLGDSAALNEANSSITADEINTARAHKELWEDDTEEEANVYSSWPYFD